MSEKIADLAAFARAAERSPEDAFRFFRSDDFLRIIPEGEHRTRALWRGLGEPPAGREIMEEFLVESGLKQPVAVTADESEVSYFSVKDTTQEWIRLRRSGWGSIAMSVTTDADFIELPTARITEDSFVGSTCDIPYRIIVGRLGEGVRTGNIWIEAPGCSIRFHVTATSGREEYEEQRAKVDRNMMKLYELRLQYMLDRIDRKKYVTESLSLIGTHYCFSTEKLTLMRLYQAYLEKLRGNADEAAAILREFRQVRFPEEEQEEELCCLYLRSLLGEEGASPEDTAMRIRSRFDGRYGSYILLKLLFLTNPDIGHYPRRRKKAAEQMFEAGVRSPFLYAELIRDLRADDSLVTSLSDCIVHTLHFAAKNSLLTEGLALRTAYLSANEKCFSPLLLRILTVAYRLWPVSGILEAIVRLIMKGQPRDSSNFPWYEKAVEQHLRVIRLYEYYIESMPENRMELLPLPVLKYFALSPESVSEESRARVYANVIRNREADPDTYDELAAGAEEFAVESLEKGRIGTDYAVLYQEYMRDLPEGQSLDTLTEAVFSERIVVDDPDVRSVAVIHDGLKEESVVPVVRGRAYIRRYTEDAQILFENVSSRRFVAGAQYLLTPIMDRREILPSLKTRPFMRGGLLLNRARELENVPCSDAAEFAFWKDAARAEELTDDLRMKARRKIINYLADHPETGFFHSGTPQRVMDLYAKADKAKLIEVLMHGDLYREAYEQLVKCGQDGVPADMLVFIAGRMIREAGDEKDEKLLEYCRGVYEGGKYDETVLRYLAEYMSGSTEQMMELRRQAESFYIDTFSLDDRLLAAVVREKKRPLGADAVFASYISHGGRRELVKGYLELLSDEILGTDAVPCEAAYEKIAELFDRREPLDFAMKLAMLKYDSAQRELTDRQYTRDKAVLAECAKRGIRLGFMKKLPEELIRPYRLGERQFVEQKAGMEDEVLITWSVRTGVNEEAGSWKTEQLPRRFRTVCSKEFMLFYGETLTYTITVRDDEGDHTGEPRTIRGDNVRMSGSDSFPRINRMLQLAREGDEETLKEELGSYLKARNTAKTLFTLEETL